MTVEAAVPIKHL